MEAEPATWTPAKPTRVPTGGGGLAAVPLADGRLLVLHHAVFGGGRLRLYSHHHHHHQFYARPEVVCSYLYLTVHNQIKATYFPPSVKPLKS